MAINHFPRHDGEAKYNSPSRFFSTFAEMIRIRLGIRNRQIGFGEIGCGTDGYDTFSPFFFSAFAAPR